MNRFIYAGLAVAILLSLLFTRASGVPSSGNGVAGDRRPGFAREKLELPPKQPTETRDSLSEQASRVNRDEELAKYMQLTPDQRSLRGVRSVGLDWSGIAIDKHNQMNLLESEMHTKVELILRRNGIPFENGPFEGNRASTPQLIFEVRTVEVDRATPACAIYVGVTLEQALFGTQAFVFQPNSPAKMGQVGDFGMVRARLWQGRSVLGVGGPTGARESLWDALTHQIESFCNDYLAANPRSPTEPQTSRVDGNSKSK